MHTKRSGFTFLELLAVLVIIAIMVLIFYPVIAKSRQQYWPIGIVLDGTKHPIPGAVLRFRDSAGSLVATVTTDAHGAFLRRDLGSLCRDTVDGFALVKGERSTGGPTRYFFSPTITQTAIFKDRAGHPIPRLGVSLDSDQHQGMMNSASSRRDFVTDYHGRLSITDAPATGRFQFVSLDRRYVVQKVKTSPSPRAVRYDVTVTAPGIITGRLLASDGTPQHGGEVYATQVSRAGRGESPDAVAAVGPTGRFRFHPLRPDNYYVSAEPLWRPGDIPSARRVSVSDGQTVSVELRGQDGATPRSVTKPEPSKRSSKSASTGKNCGMTPSTVRRCSVTRHVVQRLVSEDRAAGSAH